MTTMALEPGQRVRVKGPMFMYHIPGHKNKPYDVAGWEGEISKVVKEKDGIPLSATKPFVVAFTEKKCVGHFDEDEIEEI